jgi:hypothetical protein
MFELDKHNASIEIVRNRIQFESGYVGTDCEQSDLIASWSHVTKSKLGTEWNQVDVRADHGNDHHRLDIYIYVDVGDVTICFWRNRQTAAPTCGDAELQRAATAAAAGVYDDGGYGPTPPAIAAAAVRLAATAYADAMDADYEGLLAMHRIANETV